VRRSATEHARQEPKDEPRTRGRPALQSEVQDWAIRKTPSATIKATPPTLDRLDPLARAGGDRVENGGAADLGALPDLDLLPEADPSVAGKVECERAGRRSSQTKYGCSWTAPVPVGSLGINGEDR
jgi:hypothetical protein